MSTSFRDTCIQRLMFLERALGSTTTYRILEPFGVQPRDAIGIQAAARTIATFLGLSDFTFVVAVSQQKEGAGGRIELGREHGKEAFHRYWGRSPILFT